MAKFRWAYLGCGGIAHTTAKQLKDSADNEIVAVWNRTQKKAEDFVKKFGGKVYATAEEAIIAPDVDGVYIALTPDRHAEYMQLCIKHKKAVMCEKPFAVNAIQAEQIIKEAKEAGVYVSEAMWTWHNPTSLKIKSWISSGKIGDVKKVICHYCFPLLRYPGNKKLIDPDRVAGALMEIGIYGIRYCVEIFGVPNKVECDGRLKGGADLGETIKLHYDGFVAELANAVDSKDMDEKIQIIGTKGTITASYFHQAWEATLSGEANETYKDKCKLYELEFTNTGKEISRGLKESEIVSVQNTLETMKILDECRRQMGVVFPSELKKEDYANVKIKMISHLGFNCKDIHKTLAFYRDIMGCKVKFTLTYGDMGGAVIAEAEAAGNKVPGYAKWLQKMGDKLWCVYLEWSEGSFIELFSIVGANKRRVPGNRDLNYTHYSLEVDDLKAFREAIIARGGAKYIETPIVKGMDNALQMWMHDPEGNRFELMEYLPDAMQKVGGPIVGV